MQFDLPPTELRRLERIRKNLKIDIHAYMDEGYTAVALHSSSIILDVNQTGAELFGFSREEMIFMNAWKLFLPESVQKIMQHLLQKSDQPYRVKACRKDGSPFLVELKGYDFKIAGEPVRAVSLKKVV